VSEPTANDPTGGQPTRVVPYLCPFCGEEDLRPTRTADGKACWHCRGCLRLFSLGFHGLASLQASALSSTRTDWSDE
jgi:ribosomal protein L37AE/L43A